MSQYRSFRRSTVLTLLLGIIIPACGASDDEAVPAAADGRSAAASSEQVDPCTLLTEADARAILGEPLDQGRPDAGSAPSCQYVAESAESLTLQLLPGNLKGFDEYVERSTEAFALPAEPISGLGEKAAWVGPQLMILREPYILLFTIGQDLEGEARRALGHRLATAALQRL